MLTTVTARRVRKTAYEKARRARNPQASRAIDRGSKRRQRHRERQREMTTRVLVVRGNRAAKARARAKKAGRPFNIDGLELTIPEQCPLSGIPLDYRDRDHTPSIDRRDNARGYEADNIWVISSRANSAKREADVETARRRLAAVESVGVRSPHRRNCADGSSPIRGQQDCHPYATAGGDRP